MDPHNTEVSAPRRRWLGWLRDGLLFALLLWGVIWFQGRNMLPTDGETTIEPFSLPMLAGNLGTLEPKAGQTTLVYFFAPWCSICRSTIGHLESVDQTQTQVLVIALDYSSVEAVQAFVDDTGLSYPVHLGTRETREMFRVQGYPSYYVLDEGFRVVERAMGYLTVLGLKLSPP